MPNLITFAEQLANRAKTGAKLEKRKIPYNKGIKAFKREEPMSTNPYSEASWQFDEWNYGWMDENCSDCDDQPCVD